MMGTLAVINPFHKPAYTDLLPLEYIVAAEPLADYSVGHLTDGVLIGKVRIIRGQSVVLDRDLAEFYGATTKQVLQAVRRYPEHFPAHFMFQLTREEAETSRPRIATLKRGSNIRSLPFAFTDHGILMLANVLKSQQAITVTLRMNDLFLRMREAMLAHKDLLLRLEQLERRAGGQRSDIQSLFDHIKKLLDPPTEPRQPIGFIPEE